MALDAKHPQWSRHAKDWQKAWDCYQGQRAVKERDGGVCYLPPTAGQVAKGALGAAYTTPGSGNGGGSAMAGGMRAGQVSYQAYLSRARFHSYFRKAVEGYLGFLWTKPPQYGELGSVQYMQDERALAVGGNLDTALHKVQQHVLRDGVVGLQLDMPDDEGRLGEPRPYLSIWCAKDIVNWHVDSLGELDLVVLDESGEFMDPTTFEWKEEQQWLVLWKEPQRAATEEEPASGGTVKWGRFRGQGAQFNPAQMKPFMVRSKSISKMPFVFINYEDQEPKACSSALMDLVEGDLGLYRLEGDYRTALFMQTQATPFHKGLKQDALDGGALLLGAEGAVEGSNEWSDLKFAEISGSGLGELKEAVRDDKANCARLAGDLVDGASHDKEAEGSLELKHGAQTSKLTQLAKSCMAGLEQMLKLATEWQGGDPTKIECEPNLEFVSSELDGAQLKAIMESMVMGAPISKKALHAYIYKKNMPVEEVFEDEQAQIEDEGPFVEEDKDPAAMLAREQAENAQGNAEADLELKSEAQKTAAAALKAKPKGKTSSSK